MNVYLIIKRCSVFLTSLLNVLAGRLMQFIKILNFFVLGVFWMFACCCASVNVTMLIMCVMILWSIFPSAVQPIMKLITPHHLISFLAYLEFRSLLVSAVYLNSIYDNVLYNNVDT